jgi:hypothetical protein
LFGCFDRDLMPFRLLLRRFFRLEMNDGALGNQWRDLRRSDLDCFLHN